ncbi:MAG TPA: hypothetical protein VMU55_09545 [Solirubrobacteraceae bacterium]|nr:hypothetical protein [Solirubrobacteraceae bacterium]
MLLGAILVVLWLAVMLVFVAVCQMAARGDCAFPATVEDSMTGGPEGSLGYELILSRSLGNEPIVSEGRAGRLGERATA